MPFVVRLARARRAGDGLTMLAETATTSSLPALVRKWILPSRTMKRRASVPLIGLGYIALIGVLGGLRVDHLVIGLLGLLDLYNEKTRLFLRQFLPFIATGAEITCEPMLTLITALFTALPRLSELPAYVSLSTTTRRSEAWSRACRTKLQPMKPAPPVIKSAAIARRQY